MSKIQDSLREKAAAMKKPDLVRLLVEIVGADHGWNKLSVKELQELVVYLLDVPERYAQLAAMTSTMGAAPVARPVQQQESGDGTYVTIPPEEVEQDGAQPQQPQSQLKVGPGDWYPGKNLIEGAQGFGVGTGGVAQRFAEMGMKTTEDIMGTIEKKKPARSMLMKILNSVMSDTGGQSGQE